MTQPKPSTEPTTKEIGDTYARICQDSRFRFSAVEAAHFVGKLLKIDALQVWIALGLDNMERLADGTHQYYSRAAKGSTENG